MLIGMRNGMMVDGWKNPYITDGLVAMWDGEWNAGGGKHDPNATVWKNLVPNSNSDFAWTAGTAGVSWTQDNALLLESGNKVGVILANTSIPFASNTTMELVAKYRWVYTDNYANLQVPLEWEGTTVPCARFRWVNHRVPGLSARSYTQNRLWAYFGHPSLTGDEISSCSVIGPTTSQCQIAFNGEMMVISSNYNEEISYISGKVNLGRCTRADAYVYCARLYSRALTATEIAANYAVDKARFNLPDA